MSALFNSVFILRSKGDSGKIHTYTSLNKEFWKRFMFFHWLLWCSMPNFGPMRRGKPCLPDINLCILLFQSKGHQIPYNEAITSIVTVKLAQFIQYAQLFIKGFIFQKESSVNRAKTRDINFYTQSKKLFIMMPLIFR